MVLARLPAQNWEGTVDWVPKKSYALTITPDFAGRVWKEVLSGWGGALGLGDLQCQKTRPDTTEGLPSLLSLQTVFSSVSLVSHGLENYSRNCRCVSY